MSQGPTPALQKRSQQTRDKLLSALEEFLREKEFHDISVAEIAGAAGVSPASIYRRYGKKDGFIPALFDLYYDRLMEWAENPNIKKVSARLATGDVSLRNSILENTKLLVKQYQALGHLMRPIYTYMRIRPDLIPEQYGILQEQLIVQSAAALAFHGHEIKRKDHMKTARMVLYFYESMYADYLLFPNSLGIPRSEMGPQKFVKEVADFLYGYLTTPD